MTLDRFHYLIISVCMFAALATGLIARERASSNSDRLVPSSMPTAFAAENYRDFADYVSQMRDNLIKNKVYLNPDKVAEELDVATPFELLPSAKCVSHEAPAASAGILLIHGLSDTPFAMRDLAEAFAERCFLVRVILLPGHGTRAGDLLEVTRADWLHATRFGIDTLRSDVDEVYVGGFSLGGLLATYMAIEDREIRGVFAFSPAFSLQHAWQLRQSVWLRHIIRWADRDEPDDYARYEAMPMNGLAEMYLLTRDFQALLRQVSIPVPVFLVQSVDDAIIDAEVNERLFSTRFSSMLSRMIIYQQDPQDPAKPSDRRIVYEKSHLPEQRVIGFSHQAVHIAPNNRHYGLLGDYRSCGANSDRSAREVSLCENATVLWRGELFGQSDFLLAEGAAIGRLTFNPLFDRLLAEIDRFLGATAQH